MKTRAALILFVATALAVAFPSYIGYSGAPASGGFCAAACHGTTGGTITISGFPANYTPGQTYTVTVTHTGGSQIANFNASVRIANGSTNAGIISAGDNTAVYSIGTETNGVHFGTDNQDSGTFMWTAPSPGVGFVTLYLGGHQGTAATGPNTEIVLAAQQAGIAESGRGAIRNSDFRLEQSVVTDHVILRVNNPRAPARVSVIDRNGRIVARRTIAAGSDQTVIWPLLNTRGQRLAAGTYYATFVAPSAYRVAKFTVVSR